MRRQMTAIGTAALCRLALDDVALLFGFGVLGARPVSTSSSARAI
jgi:hypothetical protein